MRRLAVAVAIAAGLLAAAPASADEAAKAGPEQLKVAAEAFDAGVAAYKQKDFAAAAKHFEDADTAVPGPRALRQAIRAHVESGKGSLAATLAAEALARYPDDEATAKLAREVVEKFEPNLHKVRITCASPCALTLSGRAVHGPPAKRWVIYLDPGTATIGATFPEAGDAVAAKPRSFDAKEGREGDLSFAPPPKVAAPPVPVPVPVSAPSKSELPPDDPKPDTTPKPERKGISPAFFGVALGATAVLGATTIWSGVDTQNNPGPDAVRMACRGQDTSCPLYQEGLAKQTRTNALIGATAGTAAVTVVLAIFTRWRGDKKEPAAEPAAEPTAIWVDRGAVLGAAGVF